MACAGEGAGAQGPTEDHGAEATEGGDNSKFRLILVGKSGVGKSATGNTILGTDAFQSSSAANAITVRSEKKQGSWKGQSVSIVDTPALFDSKAAEKSLEEELGKCRRMCRSGLHAFLLVIRVGRFTADDMAAAKRIQKTFGDESAGRTILLFTWKEDLGGDSLETYLRETTNKNLLKLLKRCGDRSCVFNNKADGDEREKQVSELMEMVGNIIKENQEKPYFVPQGSEKSDRLSKIAGDNSKFRLILVGRSGVGKSAAGNTILGTKAFQSTLAAIATTVRSEKKQGSWKGQSVSIVDTPALFDSKAAAKSLEEELGKCREMCRSGLHAFLLVIQVGRFTAEDMEAARRVWKTFGEKSADRTILLFTCKEDLGGDSLETYLREAPNKNLRELLKRCGDRVCGFNNKADGDEREKQVSKLMEMVEGIVRENREKPYFVPQGSELSDLLSKIPSFKGGKKDPK